MVPFNFKDIWGHILNDCIILLNSRIPFDDGARSIAIATGWANTKNILLNEGIQQGMTCADQQHENSSFAWQIQNWPRRDDE